MNIDKLILKLLNKKQSLEELEILESWKKESNDNIAFLNAISVSMENTNYNSYDTDKAWDKLNNNMGEAGTQGQGFAKWLLIALLLVGSIIAIYFIMDKEAEGLRAYETDKAVAEHLLRDNSKIWLNAKSELAEISDFKLERKVSLTGEAFFDIAPDKNKPFVIETGENSYVKVVGTSFNLVNTEEAFDLAVYTGRVEFHALDRVIVLQSGDRVRKLNGAYVKTENTDSNLISWKSGRIVFDNVPVANVFKTLSEHYNIEIDIAAHLDSSSCLLRSRFENQTIAEVMTELEKLFAIEYLYKDNSITVTDIDCD